MFLGTVFLYMVIGSIFALVSRESFYYHIPFAFLIQGIIKSMVISFVWTLCFSNIKAWGFFKRYLLALMVLVVLAVISMLIPLINGVQWFAIWIISGIISSLIFGTAVAASSNMYHKKTGKRNALLWEII